MLVADLRKIIEKYNSTEKDKIIVELYKRIPKNIKEDYDIDKYIMTLDNTKDKKDKTFSIDELEKEVEYFIVCANNGLYSSPNKIISKKERAQWRFKARKYYKDLNNFVPGSPNGNRATHLLIKLFEILSYGTNYLTFSNWETFRAIQVSQANFLENIIRRILVNGATKENIAICVDLLKVKYDPYGYYKEVLYSFECCMETTEMKYTAIELLKEQVIMQKEKVKELEKAKKSSYSASEYVDYFVECIVELYFHLNEIDEGIIYFHKNSLEKHKEVKEYILLELLEKFEFYEEWIIEYEKHIGKIDYRPGLKEKYNKFKKNS